MDDEREVDARVVHERAKLGERRVLASEAVDAERGALQAAAAIAGRVRAQHVLQVVEHHVHDLQAGRPVSQSPGG